MSQASREWGWWGGWHLGNRDSTNWSHVEHAGLSGLLVAGATGLSLALVGVARGIARLVATPAPRAPLGPSSAWRWWSCTVAVALLGAVHPVLAGVCLLLHVVDVPGGGISADERHERSHESLARLTAPGPETAAPRSNGTMRVLCFGDSLTAGYWENGRRFHPYASEATRLLGVQMDHVGLSGYTPCRCARCDGAVARNAPAAPTGAAAARRKAVCVAAASCCVCAAPALRIPGPDPAALTLE
jgi:hypothetical protein